MCGVKGVKERTTTPFRRGSEGSLGATFRLTSIAVAFDHDTYKLALDASKEGCASGEGMALIGLRAVPQEGERTPQTRDEDGLTQRVIT